MESLRDVQRFLPSHGINHKEDFVASDGIFYSDQFPHQIVIQLRTPSGIQNDHGVAPFAGGLEGFLGDFYWFCAIQCKNRDIQPLAKRLQLLYGSRAVDIRCNEQYSFTPRAQIFSQFGGGSRLSRAL